MSNRRIKRPKNQEDGYKTLIDSEEFGVFLTYKDVFMTSGALGFMEQKRMKFSSSAEGIPWSVFTLDTDETIINAIALAETEDISILRDDPDSFDKKMQIFEEYAAGGFEILYNLVTDNPKVALTSLFDFIMSMEDEVNDKDRNLRGIADMLSF
ncbi:DNA phosphorothioation-associated protein 4 [Paenisporosarcina quisquiliarum]|uniref:DNA phosphorothioation-associated protein 4 n=1 Tax=Paenisporosarcina quisquiliarum TaxID=365346 RepID=A0A9X3RE67_9BACL|nr:DNA phosphorothioation-associated protein 4 [Paenisporosarcina quisquiliarum]MCZ8538291.1 DNA phosphorothioation-associated protein 4 [Paenisporosarcina quisquiliarum]